jgi:hypothetical protein
MSFSFLMFLAAAAILRLLANDAKRSFDLRLSALLPRSVIADHERVLFADFPERRAAFRSKALPWCGLQVVWNASACAVFASAFWFSPPAVMHPTMLTFIRCAALTVIPAALIFDALIFLKLLRRTFVPQRGDHESC